MEVTNDGFCFAIVCNQVLLIVVLIFTVVFNVQRRKLLDT